jgi:predicted enzyme related to lactoylglutathione lyase
MRNALVVLSVSLACLIAQAQPAARKGGPKPDVGTGRVAWFDLTTTDMAKSKEFYAKLLGWKFNALQGTDLAATIEAGGTEIGTLRVAEGKIASFNGVVYLQVEDMPAAWKKAKELGATLVPGFPFDLDDGGGAVGLLADPVGHPVGLYSRKPLVAAKPAGK